MKKKALNGGNMTVNETKELHHQYVVLFTEWVLPPTTHKVWTFNSHCIRQHARLALSADEEKAMKQRLIHRHLGHPGKNRFNNCVDWMDMDDLKINKRDRLLDGSCEACVKSEQVKKQSHVPISRAKRPLQRVYMDFWGPSRDSMGGEKYYLSLIDDCTRYSWMFLKSS